MTAPIALITTVATARPRAARSRRGPVGPVTSQAAVSPAQAATQAMAWERPCQWAMRASSTMTAVLTPAASMHSSSRKAGWLVRPAIITPRSRGTS